MSEVYESIKRGLEEAIAYQQGKKNGAIIHKFPIVRGKQMLRLIIILMLACSTHVAGQVAKKTDSKVTAVTIFRNRALVTREARLDMPRGRHELTLSGLPADLLDESVRVSGKGQAKAKILDVKIATQYTATIQDQEVRILQQKIDSLRQEDQKAADQIAILETQKSFVESLKVQSAGDISQKMMINKPPIQDWQSLLSFFNTNLSQLYAGLRQEKPRRSAVENEIKAVERQISQIRSGQPRSFKEIRVALSSEEAGDSRIEASYFVNAASWYPMYDARVMPETRKLELTCYAMIQQVTGEDWNDVKLTLSTAQPLTTSALPELAPRYVEVEQPTFAAGGSRGKFLTSGSTSYRRDNSIPAGFGAVSGTVREKETGAPLPGANIVVSGTQLGVASDQNGYFNLRAVPVGKHNLRCSFIGYQSVILTLSVLEKQNVSLDIGLAPEALEAGYAEVKIEPPPMTQEFTYSLAEIETNLLSSVFEIPTENDIPGDNAPHKVTIRMESMEVDFEHTTIPKVLEKTFLQGKAVNRSGFPFLAGEINVFLENDFVNKTSIQDIVPNDTLALSVGVDEGIKVSRRLINRFLETKGLLGGKKKVTFEYEIALSNTKSTEEGVRVLDQLPISRDEKIKIELLAPNENEVQIDHQKRIKWNVRLKPGETKRLPLKYAIEFPKEARVVGLE